MAARAQSVELIDACGASPGAICEWVFDASDNETLAKIADWIVERPLRIVLVILLAWVINRLVRRAIGRLVDRVIVAREQEFEATRRHELVERLGLRGEEKVEATAVHTERAKQRAITLGNVLRSLASIVIYGLAALVALGELDINLGPLIAGAGIAGLAIGFGAQSLVSDFLAGIFIVLEDQYGLGDVVDVGVASGTVEKVTLRTTSLRDVDGSLWVVPNGEIRKVGNKSQLWARAVLDIGVGYGADIDEAFAVIKAAADEVWRENLEDATVLEEPEIWGVSDLGDSAVSIRLAVKTEPSEQWQVGRELRRRVKLALDEAGIEIPFPQQTVRVITEP